MFRLFRRSRRDCARIVDESYTYYGWIFDQVDQGDPVGTLAGTAALLNPLLAPAEQITPTDTAFVQFEAFNVGLLTPILTLLLAPTPTIAEDMISVLESDISVSAPAGNSLGGTVLRLREGVERFMITDINNPAGSARAQSNVFIMWDHVAANAAIFNHIPGGSNVLYMDGHVEFLKYGSPDGIGPVNRDFALGAAALGKGNTL